MYNLLASPLKVGRLTLPNRLVIPAMHTNLASSDGLVTNTMIDHYQRRALGGAGLVMVEVATVQFPLGRQSLSELQIEEPTCLPGFTSLAAVIKEAGAACFLQLFHAGAQTMPHFTEGQTAVSPSGIPFRVIPNAPRALDISEVISLRERFIQAGLWAAQAGFDGIELHAAHGYLLSEFLSPLTNIRTDIYGGNTEGRCRLLIEIIKGIKENSPQLAISVRINGDDFLSGGIDIDEAAAIARILEQAGIDLLNVSAGMYDSGLTSIESNTYPEGWRLHLAAAVKVAVSVPVIGGGVILEPSTAAEALVQNCCDLVYIGRASLADYDWPLKAIGDDPQQIRPCIRCNTCVDVSFAGGPIRCAVNPEVGGPSCPQDPERSKEHYYWLNTGKISDTLKFGRGRMLIVGSGPGGMVAALTASQQGYDVTLVEQSAQLGGLLTIAALPPHKKRIAKYRDYLATNIGKSGIKVITGLTVTRQWISDFAPDLLVAAIGSRELDMAVADEDVEVVNVANALCGAYPGQRYLIIGGGETGLETAQVLASQGAVVTVVEKSSSLASNMEKKNRRSLLNSLKTLPVTLFTQSTLMGIKGQQAEINTPQGQIRTAIDFVVPACGRESQPIPQDWVDLGIPTLVLGDAAVVSSIASATRAAYLALTKK